MTFEPVRLAVLQYIMAQLAAAGVTIPFEAENLEKIDHDQQVGNFLTFALHYRDASQGSIENAPITRYDGEAIFYINVPKGEGTKPALELADQIAAFMKYKQVDGVQFQAPRLLRPVDYKSYQITPLAFSFYFKA